MNEKKDKIVRFIVIFLIFTPILSLNYIIINLNNTNENNSKKVNNDNLQADIEFVVGESSELSYVIVTTSVIVSNSENLTDFVQYKESLGFTVYVITEDDYGSATGKQRVFNVRNWLINNHTRLSIEYVLLIGNPDPDDESNPSDSVGDLPMLMCWPRIGLGYPEQSATDYIYADLTGDWDVDDDNWYGEGDDDMSGVDFGAEVYVGRIPVYDADYTTLDEILKRIINHHSNSGEEKEKIIEPMAISNYEYEDRQDIPRTDGLNLPEEVYNYILEPEGMEDIVMYEGSGINPVPISAFHYDLRLTKNNFISEFNDGCGVVLSWCHGNNGEAFRKYWSYDDGDGVPESHEMSVSSFIETGDMPSLEIDTPAFFFQASCRNGIPEYSSSLAYALLKRGAAISAVAASRDSWYKTGTWDATDEYSDNAALGYYYIYNLIRKEMTAGEALYSAKATGDDWEGYEEISWMNKMDFNLYGDPQLDYWGAGGHADVESDEEEGDDDEDKDSINNEILSYNDILLVIALVSGIVAVALFTSVYILKRRAPSKARISSDSQLDIDSKDNLFNQFMRKNFPHEDSSR